MRLDNSSGPCVVIVRHGQRLPVPERLPFVSALPPERFEIAPSPLPGSLPMKGKQGKCRHCGAHVWGQRFFCGLPACQEAKRLRAKEYRSRYNERRKLGMVERRCVGCGMVITHGPGNARACGKAACREALKKLQKEANLRSKRKCSTASVK